MTKIAIPTSKSELRKQAEYNLIAEQKCTSSKDTIHTYPSYGRDINFLADERRWLYDKLKASRASSDECLRIDANKLVLFLDPAELESEYRALLKADQDRVAREHGKLYS